jgi:two-component system sensor histidine kinase/response regulator
VLDTRAPGRVNELSSSPPPRTVLVAEDNAVNRMVARGVLEGLGYAVVFANNGLEAVAAITDSPSRFAAVLMDCQMPRLDGFEATRVIRKLETPGARVPVIALTASHLEDARELCLAAGMDDFMVQPIDFDLLETVLARWVDGTLPEESPGETVDSTGMLDLSRVRMLQDLATGQVSFFTTCLASFLARVPVDLENIDTAVRDCDHQGLFAAAHSLKGSAQNLGAAEVGRLCQRLEEAAECRDIGETTELTATLRRAVELTSVALNAV